MGSGQGSKDLKELGSQGEFIKFSIRVRVSRIKGIKGVRESRSIHHIWLSIQLSILANYL